MRALEMIQPGNAWRPADHRPHSVADALLTGVVPAGVDLAAAATVPLTWATALGLVHRSHAESDDAVLVTSAAGGVGAALAAVLARQGVGVLVGGVGSPAKQTSLAPAYVPVLRDEGFFANAATAAGSAFDVILDSVGGPLSARPAAGDLAVGGSAGRTMASPGANLSQTHRPTPPSGRGTTPSAGSASSGSPAPHLHGSARSSRTSSGWSLTGSSSPRLAIIRWHRLIEAHVRQSEGRAVGKRVVAIGSAGTER